MELTRLAFFDGVIFGILWCIIPVCVMMLWRFAHSIGGGGE